METTTETETTGPASHGDANATRANAKGTEWCEIPLPIPGWWWEVIQVDGSAIVALVCNGVRLLEVTLAAP